MGHTYSFVVPTIVVYDVFTYHLHITPNNSAMLGLLCDQISNWNHFHKSCYVLRTKFMQIGKAIRPLFADPITYYVGLTVHNATQISMCCI